MNKNILLQPASSLLTQKLNNYQKKQKFFRFSSFLLTTYFLIFPAFVQAQTIIPATDGTATVVNSNGNRFDISGGQLSADQANLFHSFREFGLNQTQIANFISNPNIRNILSRVNGGNPSIINGLIQVTGGNSNLFLINPSGIIFGSSASLNLPAAFTATTATGIQFGNNWFNVTGTNNYAALVGTPNIFAFTTSQPGSIINTGNLAVGQGQNLILLGGNVINTGRLAAPSGNILITAVPGENLVRLSQSGHILSLEIQPIVNTGSQPQEWNLPILSLPQLLTGNGGSNAAGLTVDTQGNTVLTTSGITIPQGTKANTIASGTIDVSGQTGGAVQIFGDKVALFDTNINASGINSGGTVLLGGDYQGLGVLPTASRTFISPNTVINADALESGNGGRVIVWANDTTGFYGNISARGGSSFGNGGFVEVSGKQNLAYQGIVDVSASQGTNGTILFDPQNITIQAIGANDNQLNLSIPNIIDTAGSILFGDASTADFTLSASVLERQTGNILLEASNNITIADGISLNFVNGGSITFRADADGNGNGSFVMNPRDTIRTNGRDLTISGATVTIGNIDSSDRGQGDARNVTILAQRNINTNNIDTSDQGQGNAGSVQFSSALGNIITGNIDVSDRGPGNAGSITLSAPQGQVTHGTINITNQGPGNEGQLNITPTNNNQTNTSTNNNQTNTSTNNNQTNTSTNTNSNSTDNNNQNNNQTNTSTSTNTIQNNTQTNNNQNSAANNTIQNNTQSNNNQNNTQTITQINTDKSSSSQNTTSLNNSSQGSSQNNNIYSNSTSVAINTLENTSNQSPTNQNNTNTITTNQASITESATNQVSANQEISNGVALQEIAQQKISQEFSNINSNLGNSEPEFVARLDESYAQELQEYLGLSSNIPIKTLAETQDILRKIEQTAGIKPALVYVTFVPPSIASSTAVENNQLVKQVNKPQDFPKLDFSKFTNNQQLRRKVSQENRIVGQNDVLELVLVTSQGIPIRQRIEGTKRSLVLKVAEQFQNELANYKNKTAYLASAQKLYKWLIAPLESNLKTQDIQNLVFIMDGGLRTIPIAALHDTKGFLIERYNVGMMPSFSITDTRYKSIQDLQVLAMGMAQFPDHKPLPAVPVELSAITPSLWTGKSFLNETFTLKNLKSQRDRSPFGIIHLATHAEFQPGSASESYIQLWDTKLRLNQLRQLGWSEPPVELLVLSACQTALGNEQAELGFAGLSVQAGVKSALASLWSVSDEGTLALMSNFYEQLKQVPIKAEALRRAQLAMLRGQVRLDRDKLNTPERKLNLPPELVKQRTKTLSHPYYWAGFTMIGSPW